MEIIINQQVKNYENLPKNLEELMQLELNGKTNGIAIAHNNQVVPKIHWKTTELKENDSILIITASQGG